MNNLWTEKYRPTDITGYVFKDERQKALIERWLKDGILPTILLSGSAGTGKTTLAKMLVNTLGVNEFDFLEVNASKDNGVDFIRETITRFCETMGYGSVRYILLDEADYLSVSAQAILRNLIERYSSSVRFILTCNYPDRIIPAIKSRCETGRMHIDKLDRDEFALRMANILMEENVELDERAMDDLSKIIEKTYPDMRRAIGMMQSNVVDGKLVLADDVQGTEADYKADMLALFAAGQYREARTLVCEQATPEEYQDIYRFMYENLELWAGDDPEKQDKAVLVIRDGLVKHTSCADIELNLAATFIELSMVAQGVM